jgi:glycosyltransferase involved in cell wall biosynthesis
MVARGHDVGVIYSGVVPTVVGQLPYRAHIVPHHERLYLNPVECARFVWGMKVARGILHAHGYEGAFHRNVTGREVVLIATSHHPDPPALCDLPGRRHLIQRARWARRRVIALLERRALRSADVVICTSAFSRSALRERGYFRQETRVEVVHNGAPPLPGGRKPEVGVELVCIARLDCHKGIDVLVQALSLLEEPRPQLDLVGIGREESKLRELANRLKVEHRVRFRGQLNREELASCLAGATALVLPSRAENFPLAVLEAMQVGVVIVATRVGGIPEAVRDGREALLVSPEDPAALAEALGRVLRTPELRRRLAAAAFVRGKGFTWERAAEEYENLYTSVQH